MSDIKSAGGFRTAAKINLSGRDISNAYIIEALSAALAYYFEPIGNKRKCQKAVERIAKSIAEDNIWLRLKNANGALVRDGVLEAFFSETTAGLLLDAVFNQRPAYQKERREQCFPFWIEACNPISINFETEKVLINSFNAIQKKFDEVKIIFNAKELTLIQNKITQRLPVEKPAPENRSAPENGVFADYIGYLDDMRRRPPEDGGVKNYAPVFPFTGRSENLHELKKFCYTERQFLWWSVTGAAGTGKSRLGYELCKIITEERDTWDCVFLPVSFLNAANKFDGNWRLEKNLLAIIDSFNFQMEKVGAWFKRVIESDTVNKKIRLLILEREGFQAGNPGWIGKLKETVGESVLSVLCYKRSMELMELDAPDSSAFGRRLGEYAGAVPDASVAGRRLVDIWEKLDPGMKNTAIPPLILKTAASGGAPEDFSGFSRLLGFLFEQKIKQIQAVIAAEDRNSPVFTATALSLAYSIIICEAMPRDKYVSMICRILKYGEDSPDITRVKNNFNKIYGFIYNGAGGDQPDLFCGYFVLRVLEIYGRALGHDRIVVNRAWARASHNTANFLYRAIDCFYRDFDLPEIKPELIVLLAPPRKAVLRAQPGPERTKKLEAALLYSELMVFMSSAGDAEAKSEAVKNLENLRARGYSQNRIIAYRLSQAIYNISASGANEAGRKPGGNEAVRASGAKTAKTSAPAENTAGLAVEQLENLREQGFADDRVLTLRLVKSLYNLLINQDREIGKETVKHMEELRNEGFGQDRDITLILAQSLFILTAKQDEEGVRNTVARIEALRAQGYEKDRDITLELVKALLNLTIKQDETGRKETVARIENLRAQGFERDRAITLELVKALLNLTLKQDRGGVEETVLRIQELRGHEYENDKDISLVYAQALLNLTTKQDETEMAITVARLEKLRNQGYERDRDITFELATALFNLSTRQDEAGVRRTIGRLEELRNSGFARDRDITLRLAQALFSLTTKQGAAGRREAAARIDELRGPGYELDKDMTLTLVKALYNLTIEQNPEETRETVSRIEEISGRGYSQDKDIKLLFAKALFNLTTKLDETGIAETVSRLESLRGGQPY